MEAAVLRASDLLGAALWCNEERGLADFSAAGTGPALPTIYEESKQTAKTTAKKRPTTTTRAKPKRKRATKADAALAEVKRLKADNARMKAQMLGLVSDRLKLETAIKTLAHDNAVMRKALHHFATRGE